MNIIVCTDINMGMLFRNRRQSRDRVVLENILSLTTDTRLLMNNYSYSMFSSYENRNIIVDENFLDIAVPGDYCFVENVSITKYEQKIENIILYRWNRQYPYDFQFDFLLSHPDWQLIESEDFSGFSHKLITKEVYSK